MATALIIRGGRGPFGIKFTNAKNQTYGGMQWGVNVRHKIPRAKRRPLCLCTSTVVHYYPLDPDGTSATPRLITAQFVRWAIQHDETAGAQYTTARGFRAWAVRAGGTRITDGEKAGATVLETLFRFDPSTLRRV